MSIKNKIALITGSADGIGKQTALYFAEQGARLFICDINPETLVKTKSEIEALGAEVEAIQYDARNLDDVQKVAGALIDHYGDIDILVNNTGIPGPTKSILELSSEEWDEVMEVNVRSTYYFIKLLAPYMIAKKSGKIVNFSSMTGKRSLNLRAPYCASKIAIIGLTRCVAEELGAYNINVNAVCPGSVSGGRGDMLVAREMARTGKTAEEVLAPILAQSFIKRQVTGRDIAKLVAFLSDDELSSAITGQDININCGLITY